MLRMILIMDTDKLKLLESRVQNLEVAVDYLVQRDAEQDGEGELEIKFEPDPELIDACQEAKTAQVVVPIK